MLHSRSSSVCDSLHCSSDVHTQQSSLEPATLFWNMKESLTLYSIVHPTVTALMCHVIHFTAVVTGTRSEPETNLPITGKSGSASRGLCTQSIPPGASLHHGPVSDWVQCRYCLAWIVPWQNHARECLLVHLHKPNKTKLKPAAKTNLQKTTGQQNQRKVEKKKT